MWNCSNLFSECFGQSLSHCFMPMRTLTSWNRLQLRAIREKSKAGFRTRDTRHYSTQLSKKMKFPLIIDKTQFLLQKKQRTCECYCLLEYNVVVLYMYAQKFRVKMLLLPTGQKNFFFYIEYVVSLFLQNDGTYTPSHMCHTSYDSTIHSNRPNNINTLRTGDADLHF